MITKVYSYPGITQADILIPAGNASLRVSFKDGYLDPKINRPATFATSDKVVQAIIENSGYFGRKVFLHDTYGEPEIIPAGGPVFADIPSIEDDEAKGDDVHPEVTTYEEAVKVLKGLPGVKITQLRTPSACKTVASAKGVVFPNYKFD